MIYLTPDPEPLTIAEFIAGLAPQMEEAATAVGWDKAVLARAAALKLYRQGWRTSTLPGGVRIAHRADNPIPAPLDDGPGPGVSAEENGRAA